MDFYTASYFGFTKLFRESGKSSGLFTTIAVLLAGFLAVSLHFDLNDVCKLPMKTEADEWLNHIAGASVLYAIYEVVMLCLHAADFYWYKLIGSLGIYVLCIMLKKYRKEIITKGETGESPFAGNTCTMKQLYEGDIPKDMGELILLEEEAAYYDLLDRAELINDITYTIQNCYPDKKFVISLTGKWGSGKTTILNIVKNRLHSDDTIVVIDDFDPWNYEDEEALFCAMLDTIFRHSGVRYNTQKVQSWKKELLTLIFNSNEFTKGITFSGDRKRTVADIKQMMNDYLMVSKQKIVFMIDNVERLEDKNILLLLKIVADILDLKKVVYVLSFDMRRMETVLENHHLGSEYLKKIIQMEFYVPEIDKEVKCNIFSRCLMNIMKQYHVDEKLSEELMKCVPEFTEYMEDIRDIKRFLNSVISVLYSFSEGEGRHLACQLNVYDYIMLELLRRENSELYRKIWNYPRFFVSMNGEAMFQDYFAFAINKEKTNKEAKEFFDELFAREENKRFQKLLAKLFPYVRRYTEGHDILDTSYYGVQEENYAEAIRKRRIYSGNYFPMYFTHRLNGYLDIQEGIVKYIGIANQGKQKDAKDCLKKICRKYEGIDHMLVFITLQIHSDDLNSQGWDVTFEILYDEVDKVDDSFLFLHLNGRTRATYILSEALEKISDAAFDSFLQYMQKDYKRMYTLRHMIGKKETDATLEGRVADVYDNLKQMAKNVTEQKIDLYEDSCYCRKNVWAWYHLGKDERQTDIKKAFRFMLTEKNVYRFLWDMTTESCGGMYGYLLNKESLECFCDFCDVEAIMHNRQPSTEDESFVQKLYEEYKKYNGGSEAEIYQSEERKLKL